MTALRSQFLRLPRQTLTCASSVAPKSTAATETHRVSSSTPLLLRFVASLTTTSFSPDLPTPTQTPAAAALETVRASGKLDPDAPTATPSQLPPNVHRQRGTVTSAGRMNRTVRVLVLHQQWDKYFRRYFPKKTNYMVHDPRNSLREGDVVEFVDGWRVSRRVRHVVERIISPFGTSPEARPTVMDWRERARQLERDREAGKVGRIEMGKTKKKILRRLEIEAERQAGVEASRRANQQERQRIREEKEIMERELKDPLASEPE